MRFSDKARGLAALTVLLAICACQPLPRPFAHDAASVGPLADSGGVVVLDVHGVPEPVSAALGRAMVDALVKQNIPAATSGGNVRSRYMRGTARVEGDDRPGGGPVHVEVSWALADRAGRTLGTETARMTVPRAVWIAPKHKALAALAEGPARAVAALMQDPVATDADERDRSVPLHVWPVAGAPGDGGFVLRRAMEAALGRLGYRVSDILTDDGLVIAGSVALGEEAGGRRPIEVEWTVLDHSGKEVGKLSQKNAVPTVALENGWNGLAEIIAETAADGVSALLARLPATEQDARRPAGI